MLFPLKDINPTRNVPYVTWVLVAVNVLVFLVQYFYAGLESSIYQWGLIPIRLLGFARNLYIEGSFRTIAVTSDPVATLFTSMFMHGGILHLLGNMLYLWIFGNNVEDRMGPLRFLGFYILGGIAASLVHVFFSAFLVTSNPEIPMVGASGAVAAVLGAYWRLYPRARVRCLLFLLLFVTMVELPASLVLGWWIFIQIINGLLGVGYGSGGVAWFAHIGGFFAGMALLVFFGVRRERLVEYLD